MLKNFKADMDDFSKGLDIFCKPKFYLYQKNWIGCSNYWESWWTVFTLMENYSRYDVIRFVYNLDRKTQNTFVNECRPFSTHKIFPIFHNGGWSCPYQYRIYSSDKIMDPCLPLLMTLGWENINLLDLGSFTLHSNESLSPLSSKCVGWYY